MTGSELEQVLRQGLERGKVTEDPQTQLRLPYLTLLRSQG